MIGALLYAARRRFRKPLEWTTATVGCYWSAPPDFRISSFALIEGGKVVRSAYRLKYRRVIEEYATLLEAMDAAERAR
jgi:hypothetical protein